MRVLVLAPGADTGGQGQRIAAAFRRHAPTWTVEAMHVTDNYIGYPRDLPWDRGDAQRRYSAADVVHHQNSLHGYQWFEDGSRKPAVLHHHGTRLRDNAEQVCREARSIGAVSLTSTVDLLECAPDGAVWMPAPFELPELAAYRRRRRPGPIIIAHAPTNREVKGTADVIAAVDKLRARHDIEFDLIENMAWTACLSRKGRADIFVDQLVLGYGNNAIEAWAMGIPVICGVSKPSVRDLMERTWGTLPFYTSGADTLEARLEELIVSAELREEYGARGKAHVEQWHAAPAVVERLQRVYADAPRSRGLGHLKIADLGRAAPRVMA